MARRLDGHMGGVKAPKGRRVQHAVEELRSCMGPVAGKTAVGSAVSQMSRKCVVGYQSRVAGQGTSSGEDGGGVNLISFWLLPPAVALAATSQSALEIGEETALGLF